MIEVWGLSGKAGSGKDFIYKTYLEPMGFRRWALADHFKIWLIAKELASYDDVFITKPPHVRHLLQQEGTERGRLVYGESIWVKAAFAWIRLLHDTWGINKFVISDVRYPNEMYAIKERGGKVIRIVAPIREANSNLSESARSHISETALDVVPLDEYDGVIYNDPGKDVEFQMKSIFKKLLFTSDFSRAPLLGG
jgi:hypothetical protein